MVILGHHYQRDEVVKFADFRGDSLKLSQQAAQADGKYIVFCGVHFMAESADILRRDQQIVVLPDLNAGCSMADMADIGQVEACWGELGSVLDTNKIIPVTYMNSTAAIKSFTGEHGGSVCTSSNAAAVMKWAFARGEKVLFLPGRTSGPQHRLPHGDSAGRNGGVGSVPGLGGNTPEALRKAKVILWKGYCSVHQRFLPEHIAKVRKEHPGIRVIVHPECRFEVAQAADEIGSTEGIMKAILASPAGNGMGSGDGNPPGEPAEQGNEGPQSDVAGSQRVRVHHDVPDHAAALAVGAGKSGGGKSGEPDFRGRAHPAICESGVGPHAGFAIGNRGVRIGAVVTRHGEGMAENDEDQDELPEPPQRIFTLTEAERTRRELEPFLIEAIDARKKLSELEQELTAVSTRILMMGGVLVPYAKLAEKRMEHQSLAEVMKTNLEKILSTGCLIKDLDVGLLDFPSVINNEEVYLCWKLGEERIRYYHRQDEGYAGRKPIDPRDLGPGDQVQ